MSGQRPKAYYAAGLFNQAERAFNVSVKEVLDELGYDTWFPQEDAGLLDRLIESGMSVDEARHQIFRANLRAVEEADILVFSLDGRVPDEGACIEAGIAFGRGKRCIGLQTDFRTSEPGGNNLMIDGVVGYSIARDLDDLRIRLTEAMIEIDLRDHKTGPYVAVSGPIGVGKTSLIELLNRSGNWTVLDEPIDENPYLNDVYSNLKDIGFRMNSYYLGQRASQHMSVRNLTGPVLQERCMIEDAGVFFPAYRDAGAYDDNDLGTLLTLYGVLADAVPAPDLILYLWAPFGTTVDRIRSRDRRGEEDLDVRFLELVYERYEKWIPRIDEIPVVTLDTSAHDFVHEEDAAAEVLGRIEHAVARVA
jgi:deoxyadenosine/deoxycytidine kinase/nucleoside 2-deoxyribosyltransferase